MIDTGAFYEVLTENVSVRQKKWYYANVLCGLDAEVDLGDWIVVVDVQNGYDFEGIAKYVVETGNGYVVYLTTKEYEWAKERLDLWIDDASKIGVKRDLRSIDTVNFEMILGRDIVLEVGDVIDVYISSLDTEYCTVRLTDIKKKGGSVSVTCYGAGYELTKVYVRKVYYDTTPEDIVRDLVEELGYKVVVVPTGETITKFLADDYVMNVIRFLAEGYGYQVRVIGDTVYFEPYGATRTGITIDRSFGNFIEVSSNADSVVNDLWLYGGSVTYTTVDNFVGDGSTTEFNVKYSIAGGVRVLIDGVEVKATEYSVEKGGTKITFKQAPSDGASIEVQYQYEVPVAVHLQDDESIMKYGLRGKKIVAKHINTFEQAKKYAMSYITNFSDSEERAKVITTIQKMVQYGVDIGKSYRLFNEVYGLDEELNVLSVAIKNSGAVVEIEFGEERFDIISWSKKVEDRLRELEKMIETKLTLTEYKLYVEKMGIDLDERFRRKLKEVLQTLTMTVNVSDMLKEIIGRHDVEVIDVSINDTLFAKKLREILSEEVSVSLMDVIVRKVGKHNTEIVQMNSVDILRILLSGIESELKLLGVYRLGT